MMALLRNKRPGRYVVLIFLVDDHAAFFFGAGRAILACASIGSSSPARTARIRTSITSGGFSIEPATTSAFPFSNSIAFQPTQTKKMSCPFLSVRHHAGTGNFFSVRTRSPSRNSPIVQLDVRALLWSYSFFAAQQGLI